MKRDSSSLCPSLQKSSAQEENVCNVKELESNGHFEWNALGETTGIHSSSV
jgi:hypothetical protein